VSDPDRVDPTGRWRWTGSSWEHADEGVGGVGMFFASGGLGCLGYGLLLVIFLVWTFSLGDFPTTAVWVTSSLVFGAVAVAVMIALGAILGRLNWRWWLAAPLVAAWPVVFFVASFTHDTFAGARTSVAEWAGTVGAVLVAVAISVVAAFVASIAGRPSSDVTPDVLEAEGARPKRLGFWSWLGATANGVVMSFLGGEPEP